MRLVGPAGGAAQGDLSGYVFVLSGAGGTFTTPPTNARGETTVAVPAGSYSVAQRGGAATGSVTVVAGQTVTANLTVPAAEGVQLVSAVRISGPAQFTVGQTTVVQTNWRVTNTRNEPLDYSATVTFNLGADVAPGQLVADRGNLSVSGRQVTWGGFALNPGESASITMNLAVTPSSDDAARTVALVADTRTTARTASGGIIEVGGGAVTTAQVAGVVSGGIVAAPAGSAVPAGTGGIAVATTTAAAPGLSVLAAAGAADGQPAAPAAAAAAAAQPPSPPEGLPRAGAAPGEAVGRWMVLAGLLTLVAIGAGPIAVRGYRRRAR